MQYEYILGLMIYEKVAENSKGYLTIWEKHQLDIHNLYAQNFYAHP